MSLDGTGAETRENVNSLYINYLYNQTLPLDKEFLNGVHTWSVLITYV